jgi:hypothetical protein
VSKVEISDRVKSRVLVHQSSVVILPDESMATAMSMLVVTAYTGE